LKGVRVIARGKRLEWNFGRAQGPRRIGGLPLGGRGLIRPCARQVFRPVDVLGVARYNVCLTSRECSGGAPFPPEFYRISRARRGSAS
jgi:hypothetical protein